VPCLPQTLKRALQHVRKVEPEEALIDPDTGLCRNCKIVHYPFDKDEIKLECPFLAKKILVVYLYGEQGSGGRGRDNWTGTKMAKMFASNPNSIALSTNEDFTSQRQSQNCSYVRKAYRSVFDVSSGTIKKVDSRGTFISTYNLSRFHSTESRDSCSAVNMNLTGVTRGLGCPIPVFLRTRNQSKSASSVLAAIKQLQNYHHLYGQTVA
jgi:hypothetical protein